MSVMKWRHTTAKGCLGQHPSPIPPDPCMGQLPTTRGSSSPMPPCHCVTGPTAIPPGQHAGPKGRFPDPEQIMDRTPLGEVLSNSRTDGDRDRRTRSSLSATSCMAGELRCSALVIPGSLSVWSCANCSCLCFTPRQLFPILFIRHNIIIHLC